uniref:Uncharacterized protein n=1 Tax=Anguilla anguilla TaxID=7936 RepID=A0A0E9VHI6_ANGAN
MLAVVLISISVSQNCHYPTKLHPQSFFFNDKLT